MLKKHNKGIEPIRQFMFMQTRDEDLELFIGLSNQVRPANRNEISTYILIPLCAQ